MLAPAYEKAKLFRLEENCIKGSLESFESSFLIEQHILNPKKIFFGEVVLFVFKVSVLYFH